MSLVAVFDKSAKTTQWGQNSSRTFGKTVYIHAEKMKLDPYVTPYSKTNSNR